MKPLYSLKGTIFSEKFDASSGTATELNRHEAGFIKSEARRTMCVMFPGVIYGAVMSV